MIDETGPFLPRYGERTLAEVMPSLLSAMGIAGLPNPLRIDPASRVSLLLIDGLGWELLRAHPSDAPFLTALAETSEPLTAGFPATTCVSLVSLGTGRASGQHGIVGYSFAMPQIGLVNALTWRTHDGGRPQDLRERLPPEQVQPLDTLVQCTARAGRDVTLSAPAFQERSGLTRAALRGARFRPVVALGDLAANLSGAEPGTFHYGYHGDLDQIGHRYGPGSLPWRLQLAQVDQLVASIASRLEPGALLAVTADHGMVEVPESERIDADSDPRLLAGVRFLGGEVRVRHVYAESGAASDVLVAWRDTLGDRAWVRSRDEAIAAGWFGPAVTESARGRIGDVVVAMRGTAGVVRRTAEPLETSLLGQHGSLTPAEQLVPLLLVRVARSRTGDL
ncbi:MAG: alkaline phosphatase family protein [Candidatus Nanopelagicales bacterium]